MSWFKSAKRPISLGTNNGGAAAPPIAKRETTELKTARLDTTALAFAKLAEVVPRESPKAAFDGVAKPREKIGFTVHASKNGETHATQRTSPTVTVAKARILFKSGWHVHIADAEGREYGPSEFDEILKFDRH